MPLNIPAVPLKYFLIAHFILTTWATLFAWLQECYLYTNYLVLAIGLWAMRDKNSKEPVQFLLGAHGFTILNDIILLGMYFSTYDAGTHSSASASSRFKFTAAMAILNLLLKPISALFMYKDWQDRSGSPYEDLGADAGAGASAPRAPTKSDQPAPPYMPPDSGYMPPSSANNPYQSASY